MHPTKIINMFIGILTVCTITNYQPGIAICLCILVFAGTETLCMISFIHNEPINMYKWRKDKPSSHSPSILDE